MWKLFGMSDALLYAAVRRLERSTWLFLALMERHCSFGRCFEEGWQFPTSRHRLASVFHLGRCSDLVEFPSAKPWGCVQRGCDGHEACVCGAIVVVGGSFSFGFALWSVSETTFLVWTGPLETVE